MNRAARAFALLPVLLAAVGCGPDPADAGLDTGAGSSSFGKQALCDRFRGFAVGELGMVVPESEREPSDDPIGWSASCTLRRDDSLILASLQVHNHRVAGEVEQPANFHPLDGYTDKVWMASDDPHWTELRTQVGPWVTKVRFTKNTRTDGGAPEFGDTETAGTARFLGRITRDIQG
ncbi:hypothetical protein ACWIGI_10560 [Nocardia sp. NPDC055321]